MSDIPSMRRRTDTEQEEESEESKALTDLQQACEPDRVYFGYRHGAVAALRLFRLQILPASIAKFEKLEELRIWWSDALTSLPPEIGKLSQLSRVSLSCKELMALPPQIGDLRNLKELRLHECRSLRSLPKEFGK
jgi:hypothetical protein